MYKTSTGPKPLRIKFDKIDGFIVILDGKIKHLWLIDYGLFNKIFDKIKYLITEKSGIKNSINHNFGKIRIDSHNSLPIEKYWLFIMLWYSLSQLLTRIKINTTIIYF